MPFYISDDYYTEEINLQDVSFLIWYFMNTIQDERFIASSNEYITDIAHKVMDVFDSAWDYAPENELLKTTYSLNQNETDFYKARNLIDTILFKTYLFYPDTLLDLNGAELEIIDRYEDEENLEQYLNENQDYAIHKTHTRLLGIKGKDWASRILGANHPLSKDFLNISPKLRGYFLYKDQDSEYIFIEHIASGKKFNLIKKSYEHSGLLQKIDTILYIGIVRWRSEWWFSGVSFQSEFSADLVLDEKDSIESHMAVDFLDSQDEKIEDLLQKQYEAFVDFNNESPIAFMKSDKVNDFVQGYTEYFNNSLKLSKKKREKAKQRAKAAGLLGTEDESIDFTDVSDSALVFFNPKSGVEVALEVNSAFPAPNNPFFKKDESEDHIINLLFAEDLSTELAKYCITNFKSELPFFQDGEGKEYLDDIDFLLRYWKKNSYFIKPSISFTGANN